MKKALRIKLEILSLSLLFGFLAYLLDAVLGYFIFYKEGFWKLLIFAVPPHILFTRLAIIALFALSGILITRLISTRLNVLNALSVTEARMNAIQRCTGDAVITTDISGNISFINQATEKVTGWKVDEAAGRSVDDVFYTVDAINSKKIDNPVREVIKDCRAAGLRKKTALVRRDGTKILIGGGAAPIIDDSGETGGAILVFRDESDKRNAEDEIKKSELKFRSIIETAPNVILQLSPDYEIQEFNPEAEKVYGFKREEVLGKNYLELFVPENQRENIAGDIKKVLSGVPAIGYENRILTHNGRERIFLWNVNKISGVEDNNNGIIAIGYDITDRKIVEDSIRESEEKFRNVVDSSPTGMHFYRLETDGRLIFEGANAAADKLLGLDNSQFTGMTIEKAFPGSKGTEIPERYRAAASRGEVWQSEQVNYVDEQIKGAFQVVAFQTTKNKMAALFFDITEQKLIEKELKESEERFRSTFEQAAVGIAHVAPDGHLIRINQRFCDITGYTREELLQRTFQDITHPDDVKRDVGFLHRMVSGDLKTHSIEKRYCRKDGSIVWVNLTTTLLSDKNGKPKYFISVIEDISHRKKTEEALKRTQFSVDRSIDSVFWTDRNARFIDVNEAACRALGYSREELLTMYVHDIDPNFPAEVWPDHWDEIKKKGSFIIESNHKNKDGRLFPVEIAINYLNMDGREYNCAFARDITERKITEEALKESEEKFRNLSEQSPNMIFINKRGRIVYVNNRCEEILGYNKEEFYSPDFDFFKLIDPEYTRMVKEKYERHLMGEDVEPYEYALLTKDGRRVQGIINTKIIHYEGEKSILGIVTDITSRKRAEEAVQESEEKFRNVAEQSPNMIFINKRGRIVYANNKCEEIMGYAKEEFYSPDFDFLTIIEPRHIEDIKENFARHMKGQEVEPYEYALITKDGQKIDSIINTRLIKYDGETSILGIVTDITSRKKAEKAIQESQSELAKAQQIAKVGSWEWDIKKDKLRWSDEIYRILGVRRDIEPDMDFFRKLIYPEDLVILEKSIKDTIEGIPHNEIEYRIIRPGGEIVFIHSNGQTEYDDNGKLVRIFGTAQDITERKKAEELREKLIADLQKAANEIKTLSGFIPICASCKKIRDDKGYWEQIETYIMEHSDAEFSHGLCPECSKKLYPDL